MICAAFETACRAPALDAIALERFARAAVEVNQVLAEVSPGRRAEAAAVASSTWTSAAQLIRKYHYFDAYQIIDGLYLKIRKYLPQ